MVEGCRVYVRKVSSSRGSAVAKAVNPSLIESTGSRQIKEEERTTTFIKQHILQGFQIGGLYRCPLLILIQSYIFADELQAS